jgi:hypothetical protein
LKTFSTLLAENQLYSTDLLSSSRHQGWLKQVLQGDLDALPDPLDWEHGRMLALILDGYELASSLGYDDLGKFANKRREDAVVSGCWSGSAIELWLCLFFEDRRWRHFGDSPEGEDLKLLDSLCLCFRRTSITECATI